MHAADRVTTVARCAIVGWSARAGSAGLGGRPRREAGV